MSYSPILKYPGGKTKLVPIISKYYDPSRRFVAPFCGGLGDALGLLPAKALLNDSWQALINLYHRVQEGFVITNPIIHDEENYYLARERFNIISKPDMIDSHKQESAELLVYLNRHCFNGLIRCNARGDFNSPIGKPSSQKGFHYPLDYRHYGPLFRQWQFTCKDFRELEFAEDDFVYFDPPYDSVSKTSNFTAYGTGQAFKWESQVELAELAASLPCPTLISNHATPRIVDLYKTLGATLEYTQVTRSVNAKADGRKHKAVEVFASWRI